ncbi:hypothetical protein B9Z55_003582 [Caenorhabditis nigoni]|uniref:Uncharacterized protein n=1 Tax=Caenorhabditis nigoni TaxID=1611254 RepID=A0A2G5VR64_9PELO|nr:hypothetical protein B9Z55_003582 [Caenorhabditis nigoni]
MAVNGTTTPANSQMSSLPRVGDEEEGVGQLVTDLQEKGTNFVLLQKTPQILELQTILKDRYARKSMKNVVCSFLRLRTTKKLTNFEPKMVENE